VRSFPAGRTHLPGPALFLPVVPALLLLVSAVRAENMWSVHGINYTFQPPGEEQSVSRFPIVWDLRSVGEYYRQYLRDYRIESDWNPVMELLEEAAQSGVNTAMIRGELSVIGEPGEYGTFPSEFEVIANSVRAIGLDVMAGGFWTNPYADDHNLAVLRFIGRYTEATAGLYPGDVIGVFGFDEPEVKYLENPESSNDWIAMVQRYTLLCRFYTSLPFSSFISKFGDFEGAEWGYYTDTTSVLNRFSRYLDTIIINSYPVTNNDRRVSNLRMDMDSVTLFGGTDLLPSDGTFFRAFCNRDEFFTVSEEHGRHRFRVFEFGYSPGFATLELAQACSLSIPFKPDRMASSDFRTCDVGDRDLETNLLNGAVVLWDSSSPHAGEEVVVVPDADSVEIVRLPGFPGSEESRAVLFGVGDGGSACPPPAGSPGLLCRGMTVILGCYTLGNGQTALAVFSRTPDGFRLESPGLMFLDGFVPDGILWGRFWGAALPEPDQGFLTSGGFVAYDLDGRYVTCRPTGTGWQLAPVQAPAFEGLFGSAGSPVSIFVSHEDQWNPPYCPGSDYVSAILQRGDAMLVRARSEDADEILDDIRRTPLLNLQGDVVSAGAYRPDKEYGDILLCATTERVMRSFEAMSDSEETDGLHMVPLSQADGDRVFPGLRVMDTRRGIRAGLILGDGGLCLPGAELYWDDYDRIRYEWYSESFEVAMELGVEATPRNNCLFANVQAFGRHAFGLPFYSASLDTMLFLATEPVVKGCRGLVFYSMDLALQSGGVGESGDILYPSLLQNWGPSRDTGEVDMTGRVHQVIALLTGNQPGGGPDFLAATVDPMYAVLDGDCAQNCEIGREYCVPAPGDTLLNFLAMESRDDGTILLMAANESGDAVPVGSGFQFPGRFSVDYEVTAVAGFAPQARYASADLSAGLSATAGAEGYLVLDMGGMPPLGTSLLELRPTFDGSGPGGSTFLDVACSGGSARVRFKTVGPGSSELRLYDLAGRFVESLWSGTGFAGVLEFTLETGIRPPGVYFLMLVSEEFPIVSRVTLFP
jgi:hypothetical protein